LSAAYSEVVKKAIEKEPLKKLKKKQKYEIITKYEFSGQLKYKITKLGAEIPNMEYLENVKLSVSIEKDKQIDFENYLNEILRSGKIKNFRKTEI